MCIRDRCACQARHVHCRGCDLQVGYHVVRPCEECSAAEHNGHFWLFDEGGVASEPRVHKGRPMVWTDLPYNGAEEPEDEEPPEPMPQHAAQPPSQVQAASTNAMGATAEEDSTCPVCAASPIWRPHRFRECGHVFCFGCASRECDMRGQCPLDRRPVTREMLEPVPPVVGVS